MNLIKKQIKLFSVKYSIVIELFEFLWENKLWWSIPIIFFILILMLIVLFAQGTGLAPFIYPLF